MKVAIYCRVSTAEQDTANQLLALEKLAQDRGWEIVEVYQEEASAWKDGHQQELSRLLNSKTPAATGLMRCWFGRWTG